MRNHPADPFELLCWQAAGHAIPNPPPIAGRVYAQRMLDVLKDESDPYAAAWDMRTERSQAGNTPERRSTAATC